MCSHTYPYDYCQGIVKFSEDLIAMLFKEETIHEKPYVRNQVFIYFFFSNHSTILNSFVFHGWENADLMCYYQDSHHFRQRIDKFSEESFALRFMEETIHGNLYVRNQLFIYFFFQLSIECYNSRLPRMIKSRFDVFSYISRLPLADCAIFRGPPLFCFLR